jgi:hypothetical protein
MSILRAVALLAVIVFCAGFIPIGGCAKGCGNAGRVAARQSDDIARLGVRGTAIGAGEGIAVSGARYGDDLARSGAHYGDDIARSGAQYGDDVARAGAGHADDLAHTDLHLSGAADDLEQSGLKLSEGQHDEVMDALQDVAEEVVGQITDSDDADDDAEVKRAAVALDARLEKTLTREQLRRFHAKFGSSEAVAYRLAREQRLKQASGSAKK